jgi:hypothetical protein
MTTLEDIEKAVTELPADQLAKFSAWFEDFEAARFDQKIERDAKARPARPSRRAGHCRFPCWPRAGAVRHFASPSFWEAYAKLPESVRALADKTTRC